jgi:pyruvate dehydrogenase E2 component (dihydrolipoamide acetyltransferase)
MESGTISSWALEEGAEFSAGDVLCSIETDKAAVDFEAQDDGVLAKILRKGADAVDLPVGTPICVVTEEASDVSAFADYVAVESPPATSATSEAPPSPPSSSEVITTTTPATGPAGGSLLLPSARHLAESRGLDATVLQGSGKGGRVTKGDVLQALQQGIEMPKLSKHTSSKATTTPASSATASTTSTSAASTTASSAPKLTLADIMVSPATMNLDSSYEDVANNKMRQIIAKRLTESKATVPHFYTTVEIALDDVMRLRKMWANDLDLKVSVNDFILKASALALRDVPQVNASFDVKAGQVVPNDSVDISVAVATPTGLITPIVFGADKIGLSTLTSTVQDLAKRARDGKLAPQEYQGGTFSVSNLGMFGIAEFSAVINPPQAAILAVGGGSPTVVPGPSVRNIMNARLSADRRVVDEPTAAMFAQALREYLQEPESLVL